jgi:hypothetical protein
MMQKNPKQEDTTMNMMNNRFLAGGLARSMGTRPLERHELMQLVPSAFAQDKHESRSERFAYIPTIDVIDAMEREGFQPYSAKQGGSRIPGKAEFTKHMIRFRHRGQELAVGGTHPEVILLNAHDGTSSYRLMSGLFRTVCLNGLVSVIDQVDDVRVGHTGNITDKVIEGTYRVLENSVRTLEAPREWSKVELSDDERMALAEAAHTLRFDDASDAMKEAIKPQTFLLRRRPEDRENDLWTTFNVVQENAMKGGLTGRTPNTAPNARRRMRDVSTRPINGIDQDVALNRALWQLGQRMAELKGAA